LESFSEVLAMKMKSFYGATLRGALAAAQTEWGANAMLISSRPSPVDMRDLGQVEIVCALQEEDRPQQDTHSPSLDDLDSRPLKGASQTHGERLDIAALRQELDGMRRALSRLSLPAPSWLPRSSVLAEVYSSLLDSECDNELALDVIESVYERMSRSPGTTQPDELERIIATELASRIAHDREGPLPRTVALVGPPGAGKTSTMIKLAVTEGIKARRQTHLISLDCYRVGATEQLQAYASILGLGFQAVQNPNLLMQTIAAHKASGLILIDTPGVAKGEDDILSDIRRAFDGLDTRPDVHLILPATLRSADLRATAARFTAVAPSRIDFTRLDETDCYGPMVSLAAVADTPVGWLCDGQRIPEDIARASREGLAELVLSRHPTNRVRAVA
jgi:flagellar biosynthesis protein FlhF